MEIYTEAVNKQTVDQLKKKGFENVEDSIKALKNKSAIIDTSNIQYTTDVAYMNRLISMCKSVDGYKEKIIYIPVSKWYRKDNNRIEATKTPLGSILPGIKRKDSSSDTNPYESKELRRLHPMQPTILP